MTKTFIRAIQTGIKARQKDFGGMGRRWPHGVILRCRINAAFRLASERVIYAAERGVRRNRLRVRLRFLDEWMNVPAGHFPAVVYMQ
jgi:hypothetical protein